MLMGFIYLTSAALAGALEGERSVLMASTIVSALVFLAGACSFFSVIAIGDKSHMESCGRRVIFRSFLVEERNYSFLVVISFVVAAVSSGLLYAKDPKLSNDKAMAGTKIMQ